MARNGRLYNAEQVEEMVKRYREGTSLAKLRSQFGGSVPSVRSYLNKAGVTIRPRGRPSERTVVGNTVAQPTPVVERTPPLVPGLERSAAPVVEEPDPTSLNRGSKVLDWEF